MADSIRERIMAVWEQRLKDMASTPDGYDTKWQFVYRTQLQPDSADKIRTNSVSIIDASEISGYEVSYIRNNLRVFVEFYSRLKNGDDASKEANTILKDLKKLFLSDMNSKEPDLTPLSINVKIVDNKFEIDYPKDKFICGFLQVEITYRHLQSDPTVLV